MNIVPHIITVAVITLVLFGWPAYLQWSAALRRREEERKEKEDTLPPNAELFERLEWTRRKLKAAEAELAAKQEEVTALHKEEWEILRKGFSGGYRGFNGYFKDGPVRYV